MKELFSIYVIHSTNNRLNTFISPFTDTMLDAAYFVYQKNINPDNVLHCDVISIEGSNSLIKFLTNEKCFIPMFRYEELIHEDGFYNQIDAFCIKNKYKKHYFDKQYLHTEFRKILKKIISGKNDEYIYSDSEDFKVDPNYIYLNHYQLNNKDLSNVDFPQYLIDAMEVYEECNDFEFEFPHDEVDDLDKFDEFLENDKHLKAISVENKNLFNNFNMDMYRNFFLVNNPQWKNFSDIIDQFLLRKDLYFAITLDSSKEYGTFAEDNKELLYSFFNNALKYNPNETFFIMITQFTGIKVVNSNLPMKRMSAAFFNKDNYSSIDKDSLKEVIKNSTTNKYVGDCKFITIDEMFELFNIKLDNNQKF